MSSAPGVLKRWICQSLTDMASVVAKWSPISWLRDCWFESCHVLSFYYLISLNGVSLNRSLGEVQKKMPSCVAWGKPSLKCRRFAKKVCFIYLIAYLDRGQCEASIVDDGSRTQALRKRRITSPLCHQQISSEEETKTFWSLGIFSESFEFKNYHKESICRDSFVSLFSSRFVLTQKS